MTEPAWITILFVKANPAGTGWVDTDIELRELKRKLGRGKYHDRFRVEPLPAARVEDLDEALRRHNPYILHFSGHGTRDGELIFQGADDAESQPLAAEDLAEKLRVHQKEADPPVCLVVLAGCDTAAIAKRLARHVDCAIGLDDSVKDRTVARFLTPSLYAALADGRSVANAVETACSELNAQECRIDAKNVRWYPRAGVDPARLVLTDLKPPIPALSDVWRGYLRRLFEERWACVSMNLFDPSLGRLDLADIYTRLPVDFEIAGRVDDKGRVRGWWCGRSGEKLERSTEAEWLRAAEAGHPARGRSKGRGDTTAGGERIALPHAWAELNVDEQGLRPLVEMAQAAWRTGGRQQSGDETFRWQADAEHAALVQPHFVLIGDPGSGKSTFLRHLALCWAGELRRRAGDERVPPAAPAEAELACLPGWTRTYLPIYCELRVLVSQVFPPLPANEEHVPALPGPAEFRGYLVAQLAAMGTTPAEALVEELFGELRGGRAAILLDGLDEVPQAADPRRRSQLRAFVAELVAEFGDAPIIVTARPYAYRQGEWALEGFGRAELAPLPQPRQAELVGRVLGRLLGARAAREAEALVSALERIPEDLRSNPLLLTLLAALWVRRPKGEADLPSTRGELYRRALTLLLEDWVRSKVQDFSVEKSLGLSADDLLLVLQLVACQAQEERKSGDDVAAITEKDIYSALRLIGKGRIADDLLDHLEQQAGMLLEAVEGGPVVLVATYEKQFRFLHLSFQEYLAACELLYRPGDPRPRGLPVLETRRFPEGLAGRVTGAPLLWANVLRLGVDELLSRERAADAWELLSLCCEPYRKGEAAAAVPVALAVAEETRLLAGEPERRIRAFREDLIAEATTALTDHAAFTAEQRDVAGRLLGGNPYPGHDTRPGVGLRPDGLPDIAWTLIPAVDPQTGQREFIYGDGERRSEPDFWIARYPVTYAQFESFVRAPDGFGNVRWWKGLAAGDDNRAAPGQQAFAYGTTRARG